MNALNPEVNAIELNGKKNIGEAVSLINKKIVDILNATKLDRYGNKFFIKASSIEEVSLEAAFNIAYNWREITKAFLFTSIKGMGVMAEKMRLQSEPDEQIIYVLQTAFSVISDDLNNMYPTFRKVAPKGPKGAHYKWWEETILLPLKNLVKINAQMSTETKTLIDEMNKLTSNFMGVAVQLRIVETIALDIALAFLSIFSKVEHQNKQVFNDEHKLWITTHIQAETVHNQQVSNEIYGMAKIAMNDKEEAEMLVLTQEYAQAWSNALDGLADYLK